MSKKELHPKDYRDVVFMDEAANFSFLTKSTAKSEETIKWKDGNEYPLVKVQISGDFGRRQPRAMASIRPSSGANRVTIRS